MSHLNRWRIPTTGLGPVSIKILVIDSTMIVFKILLGPNLNWVYAYWSYAFHRMRDSSGPERGKIIITPDAQGL